MTKFQPLGWQFEALKDESNTVLITGYPASGKSRLAAEKVHAFCLEYPESQAFILHDQRNVIHGSVLPRVMGKESTVAYDKVRSIYKYENGSTLSCGGTREIRGRELDIAWVKREPRLTESEFSTLFLRMRGVAAPYTQIIITTIPALKTHWIYRRFITRGEASVHEAVSLQEETQWK